MRRFAGWGRRMTRFRVKPGMTKERVGNGWGKGGECREMVGGYCGFGGEWLNLWKNRIKHYGHCYPLKVVDDYYMV